MGRILSSAEFLGVWEAALNQRPMQRAITLLACVHPELTIDQLQHLPLGKRDTLLMELREALFGSRLKCLTNCPRCREKLEIELDLGQLHSTVQVIEEPEHILQNDDVEVTFRLPDTADMFQIAMLRDPIQARQALLERCILRASCRGSHIKAAELPEQIITQIAARMAEIDPQADIQISLSCPACSLSWSTPFEISNYLWSELNNWAVRILKEVHRLARAYGWREADILSLSPLRRQFYLELIG